MPDQNDFERAAGVFDRSAQHLDELFTEPRRLLRDGVLVGGLMTIELNLLFDHVCRALNRHAAELRDLALTCRDRAQACARYQSQLRLFEAASDEYQTELRSWAAVADAHEQEPTVVASPGPRPSPPAPPTVPPAWMTAKPTR
jgi:hypothetical protein